MSKDNMLKKNFIWNTIGSLFYSCTSLFFMIIVTRINGVDEAGIFTFAFSAACLFQVFGIYAGRTYQVTERNNNISESDYMFCRIISCLFMILATMLFLFCKHYNFYKTLVLLLLVFYKMIAAVSECLYAIIQKKDYLYQVGFSMFIKAIIETVILFIVDFFTHNLLISIVSLNVIEIFVIIFYDIKNIKKTNFHWHKFNLVNVLNIFRGGFFVFAFTLLTQYILSAPKYSIDNVLSNSSQTIYGIISMPATMMVLISQFLIQPYLTLLTSNLKEKKYKEFNKIVIRINSLIIGIGILVLIIAYFLGIPFLELVYNVSLSKYLFSFEIILIGSIFYSLVSIFSNVLVTMRKNLIQFIIFLIDSVILYFICGYLVKTHKLFGACLSYLIGMGVLVILFGLVYIFEYRKMLKSNNS